MKGYSEKLEHSKDDIKDIVHLVCVDEEEEECPTCTQIEEGSTLPYSDHTCPQCGSLVRGVTETRQ